LVFLLKKIINNIWQLKQELQNQIENLSFQLGKLEDVGNVVEIEVI